MLLTHRRFYAHWMCMYYLFTCNTLFSQTYNNMHQVKYRVWSYMQHSFLLSLIFCEYIKRSEQKVWQTDILNVWPASPEDRYSSDFSLATGSIWCIQDMVLMITQQARVIAWVVKALTIVVQSTNSIVLLCGLFVFPQWRQTRPILSDFPCM